LRAALFI